MEKAVSNYTARAPAFRVSRPCPANQLGNPVKSPCVRILHESLPSSITELRKDIGVVQAALGLPWTTSPVEGQISRLKMLKRTMYGRAGFSLLRARVLHAG